MLCYYYILGGIGFVGSAHEANSSVILFIFQQVGLKWMSIVGISGLATIRQKDGLHLVKHKLIKNFVACV